jgi:hypothetical protein
LIRFRVHTGKFNRLGYNTPSPTNTKNRKEKTMFTLMKLALQVVFKPYSLGEKAPCRKFLENVLTLVKPMAAQTKTDLDDRILRQIEYILENDALFGYFYKLISDQFATGEIVFGDVNESEVTALIEQSPPEALPEAVSPILIVSLVTQIISLINAVKQARIEK